VTGRRTVRLLLGVIGFVALASLWGRPANADDVTGTVQRVGWWTSRLAAQPTVEPATLEVSFGPDGGTASLGLVLVDDLGLPITLGATVQVSEIVITGQQAEGAGSGGPAIPPDPVPSAPDSAFVEPSSGFIPPPTGSVDLPPLDAPADQRPATSATTATTAPPPPPLLPASFESAGKPWARLVILVPLAFAVVSRPSSAAAPSRREASRSAARPRARRRRPPARWSPR
jgi:hypothetical protein